MKTFKNTVIEKNKSISTVWFVKAEKAPEEFGHWKEVDEIEIELEGADYLWRQGETEYFGRL